ncbi:MAG: DEAD/DEAH box helicase family protein [Acidobacteria bacterium]|nr:DEAD/DEAH box helicase family protein [Acidobacteriota bacterium]
MNRHVNSLANLMSLRPPQRRSLEILDRLTEIIPLQKDADRNAALEIIRGEFPTVSDFEREFPSLCFALATGVGKTRLMGAFISYLHLAHGVNNFFVMAPNLTIYNKLIMDFTPNTPKYVFKGVSEFAINAPDVITGDTYERDAMALAEVWRRCRVNIFNISKINSEVRGGRSPRIKRLSEYLGESYFDYLAGLSDLVLIMDESHRYRASAGVRAINELKPVLGLELTATPFVETSRGPVQFKNVIYDYPLARAMADGFVKEPAVVTQKNFDPRQHAAEEIEQIKLEDGIRMHENVKVELETHARQTGARIVKPFLLVIARDTTHAGQLRELIQSEKFFGGQYKDKVIQVDSSKTGAEEDEMVERLLAVEDPQEPTEIVIHVNMLKEGWDVTNLYTIVPLRAANARILIEQSIGRGLRLPYGKRVGVTAVDRLNIIAHDKFQEIVDEANRPDSVIRLQQVILEPEKDLQKTVTMVVQSGVLDQLGGQSLMAGTGTGVGSTLAPTPAGISPITSEGRPSVAAPVFTNEAERKIAQLTYEVIKKHEHLPSSAHLLQAEVTAQIVKQVEEAMTPDQLALPDLLETPNVAEIVAKTAELVVQRTIDIPRVLVVPKGEVTSGFHHFTLDTATINFQPVERDILIQSLRTAERETLVVNGQARPEQRPEDYLVRALIDFDDIAYDEQADLLYDLAGQMVAHLTSYLHEEDAVRNVLQTNQRRLADFIHAQMDSHRWEKVIGYDVVVSKGFTELKQSAFTVAADAPIRDFRSPVEEKSRIGQMIFGGFHRCLYRLQKFQSETERKLAVILDRDAQKWFRPALGQFQIYYKSGIDHREYQPDFVAETDENVCLLETKARNELDNIEVQAKKEAAVEWGRHATEHALRNGGKPWRYLLIPHDIVAENMSLSGLSSHFSVGWPSV